MGDHSEKEDSNIDDKEGEKETERPSDEDLLKVIRYLVAAGVDVNIPVSRFEKFFLICIDI